MAGNDGESGHRCGRARQELAARAGSVAFGESGGFDFLHTTLGLVAFTMSLPPVRQVSGQPRRDYGATTPRLKGYSAVTNNGQ
jgi:hypothetical protein